MMRFLSQEMFNDFHEISCDFQFLSGDKKKFDIPIDIKDLIRPGMVSSVGASSPTEADIAAREPSRRSRGMDWTLAGWLFFDVFCT
jgi:hypothetical protein